MIIRWRVLLWLVAGLLGLVACSAGTGAPAVVPAAAGVDFEARLDPYRAYPEPDLALINQTGRPQFLNSYAEW